MNETSKSVKITDPIKLKKQIKLTGTLGIIIGLLQYLFLIVIILVRPANIDYITLILTGTVYIILGILIRRRIEKSKNVLYATLIFTILLVILSSILAGKITGYLFIIYAFFASSSIEYIRKLEKLSAQISNSKPSP